MFTYILIYPSTPPLTPTYNVADLAACILYTSRFTHQRDLCPPLHCPHCTSLRYKEKRVFVINNHHFVISTSVPNRYVLKIIADWLIYLIIN